MRGERPKPLPFPLQLVHAYFVRQTSTVWVVPSSGDA